MRHFAGDAVFHTVGGPEVFGTRIEARGADIFTLRDGGIVVKQALRKGRPVQMAA